MIDEEDGLFKIVGVRTPPLRLVLYSTDHQNPSEPALSYLINYLVQINTLLPGILAPNILATQFSNLWSQATQDNHKTNLLERVFRLDKVIPPSKCSGHFRKCEAPDLKILSQFFMDFKSEALGEKSTLDENEESVLSFIEKGTIYCWEDKQITAIASSSRPTKNSISVNMVYTPSPFRKKGYASNVTAALSQELLDNGYDFLTLFTDLNNATSNKIYTQIGYKPVGDITAMDFHQN